MSPASVISVGAKTAVWRSFVSIHPYHSTWERFTLFPFRRCAKVPIRSLSESSKAPVVEATCGHKFLATSPLPHRVIGVFKWEQTHDPALPLKKHNANVNIFLNQIMAQLHPSSYLYLMSYLLFSLLRGPYGRKGLLCPTVWGTGSHCFCSQEAERERWVLVIGSSLSVWAAAHGMGLPSLIRSSWNCLHSLHRETHSHRDFKVSPAHSVD